MKKFIVLFGILLVSIGLFAQDTTAVTINYVNGDGLIDFIKLNAWPIGLFVFALFETYIGGNEKFKSNSSIAAVVNFIKSLLKKK